MAREGSPYVDEAITENNNDKFQYVTEKGAWDIKVLIWMKNISYAWWCMQKNLFWDLHGLQIPKHWKKHYNTS